MEELIVRINNALKNKVESPSKSDGNGLAIGKMWFHINRQVLVMDNEERKLSYRECELLRLLGRKP
jgi:DNA-binding response OmpR family regulator